MASIKLKGDTSGEVTISAPSVAGTTTLELPATSSTLATQNALGVRNLIINGDMRIAQRGTSTTGLQYNNDNNFPCCDRWQFAEFGSTSYTAAFTASQSTDVPSGQGFANSFKMDCTTADATLESDTAVVIRQSIEAQNLQHLKYGTSSAETLTMSFWVKSNLTGTFTAAIQHIDGSLYYGADYTISSANTWEKKTITIPGDTTASINNDNTVGFRVSFYLAVGSDYASGTNEQWTSTASIANVAPNMTNNIGGSTSNEWQVTAVQLEVGTEATPFEHRPYDMELARCQRYYLHIDLPNTSRNFSGFAVSSGQCLWTGSFTYPMRAVPSLVTSGTFSDYASISGNGIISSMANLTIASTSGTQYFYINGTGMSGMTANRGYFFRATTDTFVAFSAEL